MTLALFSEHRGHLAELATAYRTAATDNGLSVEMTRYDLLGDNEPFVPPAMPTPPPRVPRVQPARRKPATPKPLWERDRLFVFTESPAEVILKRGPVVPAQPHTYTDEGTVGIALSIIGIGSHLRFWGEGGAARNPSPPTLTMATTQMSWRR